MQSADTQVVNFTIDVRSTTVLYRSLHLVSGQWSVVTPVRFVRSGCCHRHLCCKVSTTVMVSGWPFVAGTESRVALMHA